MRVPSHAAALLLLAGCSLLDEHVEDSAGEAAQDTITVLAIPTREIRDLAEFDGLDGLDGFERRLERRLQRRLERVVELEPAPLLERPPEGLLALDGLNETSAYEVIRAHIDPLNLPVRLHRTDTASLERLLPVPPCKRPVTAEASIIIRPTEPFEAGFPFEGWDATLLVHLDGDQAYSECKALPLRRADHVDHYQCFPLRGQAGDLLRRRFEQWGVHRDNAVNYDEGEIVVPTQAGSVELCVDDALLNRWRRQAATSHENMGLPFPAAG